VVDPPILAADRKKENIENPACAGLPDVFRRGEKSFYELIRCYRQLSGATLAKKNARHDAASLRCIFLLLGR